MRHVHGPGRCPRGHRSVRAGLNRGGAHTGSNLDGHPGMWGTMVASLHAPVAWLPREGPVVRASVSHRLARFRPMALRGPDPIPNPTPILTREEHEALYPLEDGEPMTVSRAHYQALTYAVDATQCHLWGVDCLVAGDFAVYYKPLQPGEAGPALYVAPDLLVAFGVTLDRDTSYCVWEVGKMPELVMEMTPKPTRAPDQARRRALYAQLGVSEYWRYDPHGDWLDPRLQGWRLADGAYQPIPGRWRWDLEAELFPSAVLDTCWSLLDAGDLRLWNPRERSWYPTYTEIWLDHQHQCADAEARAPRPKPWPDGRPRPKWPGCKSAWRP